MSEWKECLLEDVIDRFIDYRGKTPKKTTEGIPLITAKVVKDGKVITPDEFIAEDDYEDWMSRGLPQKMDVLLTTEAPLGEVAQLDNERVALAQRIILLRGKKNILDNTFLKYSLLGREMQHRLKSRGTGTTVEGIKSAELKKLFIPLPSFNEQQSIASLLSSLDNKIDLLRRQNQTLEQLAQTIFKEWFVHYQYPGATGEMEETELGDMPKGWQAGKFVDAIKLLSGGTPKTDVAEYWNGNISWISGKDVTANHASFIMSTEKKITEEGINNSATKILPRFTTVISARGTVGSYCILPEPMCISQSNYGIKSKYQNADFYTYLLTEHVIDSLKAKAYGSVFDTITTSTFEDTDILIQPLELIQEFEVSINPLFQKKLNNSKEIQTLTQFRDSLLPRLMSGKIRVT